ncbi:MAG: hypothetical protein LBR38_01065 [Synergistaceae bacterium]|jgi:hypothetical protein|nr:hypothetical protein [Synergistaceae bacterium]
MATGVATLPGVGGRISVSGRGEGEGKLRSFAAPDFSDDGEVTPEEESALLLYESKKRAGTLKTFSLEEVRRNLAL